MLHHHFFKQTDSNASSNLYDPNPSSRVRPISRRSSYRPHRPHYLLSAFLLFSPAKSFVSWIQQHQCQHSKRRRLIMSLYYDASIILTSSNQHGGSFKSRIYNSKFHKASPAQIYALITEASKWDILLKEVVENAGVLSSEPKVGPNPVDRR